MLRVPLLPLDTLEGWAAMVESHALPDGPERAASLAADAARLRASYRALLADPLVREAIFVASTDLHAAIDSWLLDPRGVRARDIERALTRYLTRMASRPTPFGLFASVAAGCAGDATRLTVAPRTAVRRHTRLDIDYLARVVDDLLTDPAVRAHVRYRPSDTVCRLAGSWRYVETHLVKTLRTHHLVSVEDNDAVSAALTAARAGVTPAQLAYALRRIGREDAEELAAALIESGILTPDLASPVTGISPARALVERLSTIPADTAIAAASALRAAVGALGALDAGGVAAGPDSYGAVVSSLAGLPVSVAAGPLFQVDMARPPGASLSPDDLSLIRRAGDLLYELCPDSVEGGELERLKRAWVERFDEREVRLLEALDAEDGVGSELGTGTRGASVLLDGLHFPEADPPPVAWGAREQCLLSLIVRAAQAGQTEVELAASDMQALRATSMAPSPAAFAVTATLASTAAGSIEVVVHSAIGPSSVRLMGRFCHTDPAIEAGVRHLIADEEALDPAAVHAEIVHLPEGRVGNVILRPVLRDYEIPVMGSSGADDARQLPLSDLTVQLVNGSFVLRSTRLGVRVIPHMTTAHNYGGFGVGAYRFLCLLQADGQRASAAWSWGPLSRSPFLPRVRLGAVVLSRAAWRLTRDEIASLQTRDVVGRFTAVQHLRTARALPRWVVFGEGDNQLVVDLENVLAVDSLVQLLKEQDDATLEEWYPGPDRSVARGPEGVYASELIVPFVSAGEAPAAQPVVTRAHTPHARTRRAPRHARTLLPGSDWIFAKAYGGGASADRLLLDIADPLSRRLEAKGAIERWFFIRYHDPGEHVRWRMQVKVGVSVASVRRHMERALATAVERQLTWRIAFDTYEREIERYGGVEATLLAERLFHADSVCAIDVLRELDDRGGRDDRWLATAMSIDLLLTDLGMDLPARAATMREARERFGREFKVDAEFRRRLAERMRPVAKTLDHLLTDGPERGSVLAVAASAFARRRRQWKGTCAALTRLERTGTSTQRVPELAFSYVHMTANRFIRADARMHELVLYDFLARTYASRLARTPASR